MIRIGVISDTHDHIEHAKCAVDTFKQHKVHQIIHCGDFCSPFMMALFKEIPTVGVFGNNDGDIFLLQKKALENGVELQGGFWETECEGVRVAVYHGTYSGITDSLIKSGKYDLVITGHTHKVVNTKIGSTIHLNPGTCNGFGAKASVMIIELPSKQCKEIVIE